MLWNIFNWLTGELLFQVSAVNQEHAHELAMRQTDFDIIASRQHLSTKH